MKTEGSLVERDVPDLVQTLSFQRFSGHLRLERTGEQISITAEDGRLVFASTSNPDYRLGPRLLRHGAITLRQMVDAGRSKSSDKRFGTVLVEMGALDPKELVRGVVDQTRDIILRSFHWTEGAYRLEEGKAPGEAITLKISTPQLILDGISQIEAWSRVEHGSGGLTAQYTPADGAEALFKQLSLDFDQAALFRAVKETRNVEALCAGSVLNDFEVCRNLWAYRVIGLLHRIELASPVDEAAPAEKVVTVKQLTPLDDDGLNFVLPEDDS